MKVAIILGSKSDTDAVKPAFDILKKYGVDVSARVISAHRSPDEAAHFAKNAQKDGYEVVIAAAGKAAHLAGVIAAFSNLPIIGLPVKSSTLDGLDSLLSTVQMPAGVPVACVAINGAENAGLLALRILSIKYPEIAKKLAEHKENMKAQTVRDDKEITSLLNK
jgi:5-(carboxyamino)imidazole ribonucleotide mutase